MVDLRENTTIRETICLLDRLTSEKWLMSYVEEIEDDGIETMYSYGPRVFLELKDLVLELNISHCAICKAELVRGVFCPQYRGRCDTIVHRRCLDHYRRKQLQFECYQCNTVLSVTDDSNT